MISHNNFLFSLKKIAVHRGIEPLLPGWKPDVLTARRMDRNKSHLNFGCANVSTFFFSDKLFDLLFVWRPKRTNSIWCYFIWCFAMEVLPFISNNCTMIWLHKVNTIIMRYIKSKRNSYQNELSISGITTTLSQYDYYLLIWLFMKFDYYLV